MDRGLLVKRLFTADPAPYDVRLAVPDRRSERVHATRITVDIQLEEARVALEISDQRHLRGFTRRRRAQRSDDPPCRRSEPLALLLRQIPVVTFELRQAV